MKVLTLAVVLALTSGCEDNEGRGELLSGPGVEVHCAGQQKLPAFPQPAGVGDTDVKVTC